MADGGARPGRRSGRFADVRRRVEVDSTNRVVADLARSGAPDGVVVVADHQTDGRGRRGRSWVAPPGSSLLVSALLRPGGQTPVLTTVVASLAASDALQQVAGLRPTLRWPNDLYVDGRKLGGVLAEVVHGEAVVLGVGVNLRWPSGVPEAIAGIAASAEEGAGRAVDRDELLGAFLDQLERRLEERHEQTLADYRDRCETLGRSVRVTLPGGATIAGLAAGLDDWGRLIVDADGTVTALSVGDVEHVVTP